MHIQNSLHILACIQVGCLRTSEDMSKLLGDWFLGIDCLVRTEKVCMD